MTNENNTNIKQAEQPEGLTLHPFLMHTGSGRLCGKSCGRQDKQLNIKAAEGKTSS